MIFMIEIKHAKRRGALERRGKMKIAVIGPGAMGLLYGAKLSRCTKVVLIGNNAAHGREINENGIVLKRDGAETLYHVPVYQSGQAEGPVDLIILFTKAYLTEEALAQNKELIGPDTVLLTLQNGAGHEAVLAGFTDAKKILIGTTAQGSYRENAHTIVNSGLGETVIGAIDSGFTGIEEIAAVFTQAGFPCRVSGNIRQTVWNKLMINASSSVLSGVLGVRQGYVAENADAWEICKALIGEICEAAAGEGFSFDPAEQTERIRRHLNDAPGGYTSIYADLKNGRKTEVDFISGAVVRAAARQGREAPVQQLLVHMVHAMEEVGKDG